MRLEEIVEFLDEFLKIGEWRDKSVNGLQVEGKKEVEKIAFAVDACMEVFRRAKESEADLIVVHHGLIWNGLSSIRGLMYRRIEFLIRNGISLYAAHIPLDAHRSIGNNVQILRILDLEPEEEFGEYQGKNIGYIGSFKDKRDLDDVIKSLKEKLNPDLKVLRFGGNEVKRIGAVSGRGGFAIEEAIEKDLDLFITGEVEHEIYHIAREGEINVVFGGHYATETLGIKALMRVVSEEFEIKTEFIDVPTGL